MSLMDKLKSLFSGGSGADAHDHSHADHDHSHDEHASAVAAPPVAPLDPLGTPPPGSAAPDLTTPAAGTDDEQH